MFFVAAAVIVVDEWNFAIPVDMNAVGHDYCCFLVYNVSFAQKIQDRQQPS